MDLTAFADLLRSAESAAAERQGEDAIDALKPLDRLRTTDHTKPGWRADVARLLSDLGLWDTAARSWDEALSELDRSTHTQLQAGRIAWTALSWLDPARVVATVLAMTKCSVGVRFDLGQLGLPPEAVRWVKTRSGNTFFLSARLATHPFAPVLLERLIAIIPFLQRFHREHRDLSGECDISLGDVRCCTGLAFCAQAPTGALLPDSVFLASKGYRKAKQDQDGCSLPWPRRRASLLWRGSATGWFTTSGERIKDWTEIPRVRLAQAALRGSASSHMDIGLTSVPQLSAADAEAAREQGLLRGFVPVSAMGAYKYHVDIDGNTSAWMSLFMKLYSGGTVLRVTSSRDFRQWYHDRLIPWEHFVPVLADMSNLHRMLEWCMSNDDVAREIGANGRRIALEMTLDNEAAKTFPAIAELMRRPH